jgi:hypothetical protein
MLERMLFKVGHALGCLYETETIAYSEALLFLRLKVSQAGTSDGKTHAFALQEDAKLKSV